MQPGDRGFSAAIDRHITGNYGEDQYRDYEWCDGCPHDNEDTGECDLHKHPSVCKMEDKESYLANKADDERKER
jgi:hypothetical protein